MLEIIDIEDRFHWDEIVTGFSLYDVYYLSGYVKAFQIHGDGEPQLLFYETADLKAIYVYMKRTTIIEGVYDSISPYGYGGVLFEGNTSIENLMFFWAVYVCKMKELNIVDNFVRYHPVLANALLMEEVSEVIDLGKTVALDLTSPEVIWANIISKNRNVIRKAEKNGIEIHHSRDSKLFKDFIRIYNATMDRDNAVKYYYFEDAFYESIHNDLHDNYELFYAVYKGEIIAMSIILFANRQMHYHLSGSLIEYRNLAPSNLLLYKAALWGYERGYRTFHLGGGVGSGKDNLYKFKAAFNRNSDLQFFIGKQIFDEDKYQELVTIHSKENPLFNMKSCYFPIYRQFDN